MFGSSWFVFSLFLWVSSVVTLFYVTYVGFFWVKNSWLEDMIYSSIFAFVSLMKNNKLKMENYGGSAHLMFSLTVMLLTFNLMGILPFTYSLMIHFIVSLSISIPFWLMTVLLHGNMNWRSYFSSHAFEGAPLGTVVMVILAELTSILFRPITLAVRISMNVIIGQLLIMVATSMSVYVVCMISFSSFLGGLLWLFISMVLVCVEVAIMLCQCMIFAGLLVSYMEEVSLSY